MNYNDLDDKPSLFILGREFIIVIVVIFSGLSFTLGYFVGKMTKGEDTSVPSQTAEAPAAPQKPDALSVLPDSRQPDQPAAQSQETQISTDPRVSTERKAADETIPAKTDEQKPAAPGVSPAQGTKDKEIIYTVQLGAFKSSADAENFKTNFDKKGYKTYIMLSKNSKNEKIYKVRTGEFRNRKDADILSLKLKKNENLNTFVTFKNE